MRKLLGAVQFLTVLPIHARTAAPGESAVFFPLIGALLGLLSAAIFQLLARPLGAFLSALLALSALVALTGGLHEDGLSDCADALRAGRTRERMLAILKDSRIGSYGAAALFFSFAIRWQALARLRVNPLLGMISALAISRSSMVLLAGTTATFSDGLGASFAASVTRVTITLVSLQAVAAALLCGAPGVYMLLVSVVLLAASRAYFLRRLGGVNGDCLGAACLVVETANLVVLAWQSST